ALPKPQSHAPSVRVSIYFVSSIQLIISGEVMFLSPQFCVTLEYPNTHLPSAGRVGVHWISGRIFATCQSFEATDLLSIMLATWLQRDGKTKRFLRQSVNTEIFHW